MCGYKIGDVSLPACNKQNYQFRHYFHSHPYVLCIWLVATPKGGGVSAPLLNDTLPAELDKQVSKENTGSTESTKGADSNETSDPTQVTTTATANHQSDKAGHKTEAIEATGTQHSTASELSTALLAQQLPPLPKYNGSSDSSEETFQEWIA